MLDTDAVLPAQIVFPASGIMVMERHYGAGFQMRTAIDPDYLKLVYVLQGEGALCFMKKSGGNPVKTFRFQAGDAILIPPHTLHLLKIEPEEPPVVFMLFVEPRHLDQVEPLSPLWHTPRFFRQSKINEEFRVVMQQILFEQTMRREAYAAAVTAHALHLLVTLYRWHLRTQPKTDGRSLPETVPMARVQGYVKELEHRFFENERHAEVARRLGLSKRRFAQLFDQITQSGWLPYVHGLRVRHAQRLLLQKPPRSTLAIVFECGFGDLSTFHRVFKKHTGLSPNAWRAKQPGRLPGQPPKAPGV